MTAEQYANADYCTIMEFCRFNNKSRSTVWRYMCNGVIPFFVVGKKKLINLVAFREQLKHEAHLMKGW